MNLKQIKNAFILETMHLMCILVDVLKALGEIDLAIKQEEIKDKFFLKLTKGGG